MLIALKSLYNMAVYYKHHNKVLQGRAETHASRRGSKKTEIYMTFFEELVRATKH